MVTAALCPQAGKALCNLLANPTGAAHDPGALRAGTWELAAAASVASVCRGPSSARATRRRTPIDPFHLAARGLDPGIGTMLFQGVAEVR